VTLSTSEWWEKHGYLAGKRVEGSDDLWICLISMIYTYRLAVCDEWSVMEHYCYEKSLGLHYAQSAFQQWDGKSAPIDGWTRHHV
jgi:hypothetical protein